MLIFDTPSTLVGRHLGMDPYFLDKDNDLSFRLGRDATNWLTSGQMFEDGSLYQSHIRSLLFPSAYSLDHHWRPVVEDYINNEFNGLFARHVEKTTQLWDDWVSRWRHQEMWVRQFIDDPAVVDQLLRYSTRADLHKRVLELKQSLKTLFNQYQVGDSYEYHWRHLQERASFRQPIRPSDVQFFMFRVSLSGILKQLVALEWTRNVREAYAVNNQLQMDIQPTSLSEAFI